ncbi:MAG: hypothetical protein AUH43_10250 [Acidobacteria bacterium 13_1_40CM_65_14]|nr:MAG: hypothetical protein AUH43_10250 [Acidobacteria bacterium 13_1_40CM_65_14]
MGSFTRFIHDDQGADLIEYALLAGLISLACVGALTTIGTDIGTIYNAIATKIGKVVVAP